MEANFYAGAQLDAPFGLRVCLSAYFPTQFDSQGIGITTKKACNVFCRVKVID
jgi:hypothetical protein